MNRTIEATIAIVIAVIAFGIMISFFESSLNYTQKCFGEKPITSDGTIIGVNDFPSNSKNNTWVYDLSADGLAPCLWKCKEGYQKQDNTCIIIE